ncbi:MAG: hypothetical protein IT196_22855 [Acidimicrobiales bacterium]|nr:hypothetical protein [Acidimicrobiales bacterium]
MTTLADTSHTPPAADLMHIERWNDPLVVARFDADTDEALITGTDAMFDSCECVPGGAR